MIPPLINAHEAIQRLHLVRPRSLNATEALEQLDRLRTVYQFRLLYQTFFPKGFENSTAAAFPARDQTGHSDLEIELLELINQHLFPIGDDVLEIVYEREERLDGFFVVPYGSHWGAFSDVAIDEVLSLGWQLLLPLCESGRNYLDSIGREAEAWYTETFNRSLDSLCRPNQIRAVQFHRRSRKSDQLCNLPLAIKVLGYCTGNLWIDEDPISFDEGIASAMSLSWTVKNARKLQRHWQQVKVIYEKVNPLIAWIEADLSAHSAVILEFWNQCK